MPEFSFSYKDISSKDYGIYVEKRPEMPGRTQNAEYEEVAGRDETLVLPDTTLDDVKIEVECSFKVLPDQWNQKVRRIRSWLKDSGRLTFSDAADSFWKVKNITIDSFERPLRSHGIFQVVFLCSPFEYFKDGTREYSIEEVLYNSYAMCRPIYAITGEGMCTLTVNGKEMTANVGQNLTINTDLMLAYREDGSLMNTAVSGDYEDLYLYPGENEISITGGFELKVIPNWRCY